MSSYRNLQYVLIMGNDFLGMSRPSAWRKLMALVSYSVFPIIRVSVQIRHCHNEDLVFSNLIYDSIRESSGSTPPCPF